MSITWWVAYIQLDNIPLINLHYPILLDDGFLDLTIYFKITIKRLNINRKISPFSNLESTKILHMLFIITAQTDIEH